MFKNIFTKKSKVSTMVQRYTDNGPVSTWSEWTDVYDDPDRRVVADNFIQKYFLPYTGGTFYPSYRRTQCGVQYKGGQPL